MPSYSDTLYFRVRDDYFFIILAHLVFFLYSSILGLHINEFDLIIYIPFYTYVGFEAEYNELTA